MAWDACGSVQIEAVEKIVGAVAAAEAHDGAGGFIGEGGVQIGEALLGRSGKVERSALESVMRRG